MNYLKISICIFLALAASRFVPHPPNFTSLLALSFYVPAILGRKFLPSLFFSFVITDFIIGFHNIVFFTWGSVVLIGLISKFFLKSIFTRLSGALIGAIIFFILSNLGVWINGMYGHSIDGLILCYTMALPFFSYSLISTLLFSLSIEMILLLSKQKSFFKNTN